MYFPDPILLSCSLELARTFVSYVSSELLFSRCLLLFSPVFNLLSLSYSTCQQHLTRVALPFLLDTFPVASRHHTLSLSPVSLATPQSPLPVPSHGFNLLTRLNP